MRAGESSGGHFLQFVSMIAAESRSFLTPFHPRALTSGDLDPCDCGGDWVA